MKNYWVFQYTTNVYPDVFQDLDSGKLAKWEVNKHLKKIKKGDEALIYIGGTKGQLIYGTVNVTSDPYFFEEKAKYYCGIKVKKRLLERRISYKKVRKEVPGIKVGISGTNFSLSKEELDGVFKL